MRHPVIRSSWSAAACHPLTSLALLPRQSDGFVAASYTAVSGAAAIVYGLHSPPIVSVCAVFPLMCFRVRLAFTFLAPTNMYALVSLGLLLRIGDSFLTRNFLLVT